MRRAAALALVLAASVAEAKPRAPDPPPPAKPEANADGEGFWARAAHPNRKRYEEPLAQGRALYDQERNGAAVEILTEAVRVEPALPDGWYFLGMAFQRLDRWTECADALGTADRLHPGGFAPTGVRTPAPQPQFTWALCAAAAGRYDEAATQLEAALGRDKVDGNARFQLWINLGEVYMAQGRLEEAIAAYERAGEVRNHASVAFSLAVALDRDEQLGRSREVLIDAITRLDPALATLSSPQNLYVPAEDEDYYRGLALAVIATSDARKTACAPWTCRVLARAYFRRYVLRAPESPWRARADAHLGDLGGGAPTTGEVHVQAADGIVTAAYEKVILGATAKLQACTQGAPLAVYVIDGYLPGKAKPAPKAGKVTPAPAPPPPPQKPGPGLRPRAPGDLGRLPAPTAALPPSKEFRVTGLSPPGAMGDDAAVRRCLVDVAQGLAWPAAAASAVRVVFVVAPL